MGYACWFGHKWKLDGGVCADGWIWTTNRCERCGEWQNELMRDAVRMHDARGPLCVHCDHPLGNRECADESGAPSGVHAECWSAYLADRASVAEDAAVDRAQEWADNAADTDSDTARSEGGAL